MTSRFTRLGMLRNPVHAVSFGGGLGLLPVAPGTFGTVPGFALAWLLRALAPAGQPWVAPALLVLLFVVATRCAQRTATDLGAEDPGSIVCDEYIAFAGLLLLLPLDAFTWTWAFLAFRLFDVTKPFPVGWADRRLHGGFGIMADDVLAAAWAWLLLRGLAALDLPGGPLA